MSARSHDTLPAIVSVALASLAMVACRAPERPRSHPAPAAPQVASLAALPPVPGTVPVVVPAIVPRLAPEDGCAPERLPGWRGHARECELGPGVTMWLARRPHTPLARVEDGRIDEVDVSCCAPFAARGTRWHEVDRWGQDVGEVTVAGGEFYDATRCIEQCLDAHRAPGGVGLLVSSPEPWRSPPSARLDPTPAQWTAALALDATVHTLTEGQPPPAPLAERVLFFRAAAAGGGDFLVLGGVALVIARWNGCDRWVVELAHVKADTWPETHAPVAVFDMNGDGFPEVVVEADGGDGWGDTVYTTDGNGRWERRDGIGGSTA